MRSDRQNAVISRHRAGRRRGQPPPKPKAWANEPKPPRLTPDDDSVPPADEPCEEESPPKKEKPDEDRL
jgi:hypothetical protein